MGGFKLVHPSRHDDFKMPKMPKEPEWPSRWDTFAVDLQRFDVAMEKYKADVEDFKSSWDEYWKDQKVSSNDKESDTQDAYSYYLTHLHSNETPGILDEVRFRKLVNEGKISFPSVAFEDIKDRSKTDVMSKAIAIIQTTRFILECGARVSEKLALTELELFTLGLAVFNASTYLIWWDKPLDAQQPVLIYLKGVVPDEVPQTHPTADLPMVKRAAGLIKEFCLTIVNVITSYCNRNFNRRKREELTRVWPGGKYLWWCYMLLLPIWESLGGFVGTDRLRVGATHVPLLYCPRMETRDPWILFTMSVFGVASGSIHLGGWILTFPTTGHKIVWCVASVMITVIPAFLFFVGLVVLYKDRLPESVDRGLKFIRSKVSDTFLTILLGLHLSAFLLYIPARTVLLIQALVLLKEQPKSALLELNWTAIKFIPHIS